MPNKAGTSSNFLSDCIIVVLCAVFQCDANLPSGHASSHLPDFVIIGKTPSQSWEERSSSAAHQLEVSVIDTSPPHHLVNSWKLLKTSCGCPKLGAPSDFYCWPVPSTSMILCLGPSSDIIGHLARPQRVGKGRCIASWSAWIILKQG